MIQGNFYERLHFYMDNCAISPTTSLFMADLTWSKFDVPPWKWKFWDFVKNELLWWERLEKLRIRWNWPSSQSDLLFGGKPGKSWKLTKIGQFEPFWWENWPLRVILRHFSWKQFKKFQNLGKLADVSHFPEIKMLRFGKIMSHFWWEKIGKGVNWAKLTILSQSELFLWEKMRKVENWPKLAILCQSEPL